MFKCRTWLGGSIVALALTALLLACGGDDDAASTANEQADSSPAPAASPSGGSSPNAGAVTTSRLSDLGSYKYSMKVTGHGGALAELTGELGGDSAGALVFETSGAYIKPDKAQSTIKTGALEVTTIVIGRQQWSIFLGQTLGPSPATAQDIADSNILLSFWDDGNLPGLVREFSCGSAENVNGVSARKCTLDKAKYERIAAQLGDFLGSAKVQSYSKAGAELWLAQPGIPVRLRMDVAGKDAQGVDFDYKLEVDVTDINASFQIDPPKS